MHGEEYAEMGMIAEQFDLDTFCLYCDHLWRDIRLQNTWQNALIKEIMVDLWALYV